MMPDGGLWMPTWLLLMVLLVMVPPPLIPYRELPLIRLSVTVTNAAGSMSTPSTPFRNWLP